MTDADLIREALEYATAVKEGCPKLHRILTSMTERLEERSTEVSTLGAQLERAKGENESAWDGLKFANDGIDYYKEQLSTCFGMLETSNRERDEWKDRAIAAESSLARLQAECESLRDDMKHSSDRGFTNSGDALNWSFRIGDILAALAKTNDEAVRKDKNDEDCT